MPPNVLPLGLDACQDDASRIAFGSRAVLLRGFARDHAPGLVVAVGAIAAVSPFRHMVTPGGREMLVALTNCGQVGWVTDRAGYRYAAVDPATGSPWP
jgi:alkylated DNA repair protein (DNA oxidative demethylase)